MDFYSPFTTKKQMSSKSPRPSDHFWGPKPPCSLPFSTTSQVPLLSVPTRWILPFSRSFLTCFSMALRDTPGDSFIREIIFPELFS